jgi:predicted RNase H-like nuclease
MWFVGLDLAWSERNTSGAVVLASHGGTATPVAWEDSLGEDREIIQFLLSQLGEAPALVAIDAPLVVPNLTGARRCDRELSHVYREREAGALPANRARLGPRVRGEALVRKLALHGFGHSLQVPPRRPARQLIEVYPHPAAVELFGLEKTLKYKARPGRPLPFRQRELARYRQLLLSLADYVPSLEARSLLERLDPRKARGRALKRLEDLLDALFCAYIACYIWWHGPLGYRCFGDLKEGYILVPRPVSCQSDPGQV